MGKLRLKRMLLITTMALCLIVNTVYAAAKEKEAEPEILTVEKAVKYAINNSNELKKAQEDVYIAEQKHDDLKFNLYLAQSEEAAVQAAIALTKNEVTTALSYPSIENQKKSLEITITRYFSSIQSAERDLELYDKKLELDKRDLEITKVKSELGMVSKSALSTSTLVYEKSAANRSAKVKAINDAYKALADIMGVSDITKYKIELEFKYKPYQKSNLSGYIEDSCKTNYKLMEAEENYRVAKYEYDITSFDSTLSKETSEIKLTQQQRSIADLKSKLKDTITTYYNDILNYEQSYDLNMLDYENMKKQLEIKLTQLELGKITQIEVDKYEYDMQNAYNEILKIISSHEIRVLEFTNPQLL